ncbi:MAG: tyrosine-type recombinase/integrase [Alphaproteobacteria bacterium]|nr:tyrosine-type recombinase/integrase [Alphaproteobacteria bacterium]
MPEENTLRVDVRYLVQRGPSLRYRRVVPKPLRSAIGCGVWTKTFKPGTPRAEVLTDVERLARHHDSLVQRARAGEVLDPKAIADAEAAARTFSEAERLDVLALVARAFDPTPDPFLNALRHGGKYVPEVISLQTAYERDQKRYAKGRDAKPFDYAVDTFAAIVGAKDVRLITRADAFAWIEQCRRDGLSDATISRRANSLRALLNRTYLDLEVQKVNPFEKLGLSGGHGSATDRLPFHKSHLALIDAYIAQSSIKPETRDLLQLLKFTGAGPAEIGGLLTGDVSLDGEIPFIAIRNNSLRRLKTKMRERRIPLIGEALDAARAAVKRAEENTRGNLFPTFGVHGRGADMISSRLNAAIRRAGVPVSPRLVAYSFRHSMIEALKVTGASSDLRRLIAGHAAKDAHDKYGAPAALLREARDAMLKAVERLGDVDESIYAGAELVRS